MSIPPENFSPISSQNCSIDSFTKVISLPSSLEPILQISRQARLGHACNFCKKRRIRCFTEPGSIQCDSCTIRSQDCITNKRSTSIIENSSPINQFQQVSNQSFSISENSTVQQWQLYSHRMWFRAKLGYGLKNLIGLKIMAEELGIDNTKIDEAIQQVQNSLSQINELLNNDDSTISETDSGQNNLLDDDLGQAQ